jgi:hypothetical protein
LLRLGKRALELLGRAEQRLKLRQPFLSLLQEAQT